MFEIAKRRRRSTVHPVYLSSQRPSPRNRRSQNSCNTYSSRNATIWGSSSSETRTTASPLAVRTSTTTGNGSENRPFRSITVCRSAGCRSAGCRSAGWSSKRGAERYRAVISRSAKNRRHSVRSIHSSTSSMMGSALVGPAASGPAIDAAWAANSSSTSFFASTSSSVVAVVLASSQSNLL